MKNVLLSDVYKTDEGFRARSFYDRREGFGEIRERGPQESALGGLAITFFDAEDGPWQGMFDASPVFMDYPTSVQRIIDYAVEQFHAQRQ